MQQQHMARAVIAHHHGVMPDRVNWKRQILEHQHRVARRHFAHDSFDAGLQRVSQQALPARGGHHFRLQ